MDLVYCAYVACPSPPDIEGLVRRDNHDKSPEAIHNFTTIISYVSNIVFCISRGFELSHAKV